MKVLFISNFFPFPESDGYGGYELWCQEVCDGLWSRDHQVLVLTSQHDMPDQDQDRVCQPHVRRDLELELAMETGNAWHQFLFGRRRREQNNQQCLLKALTDFDPDAIMIWGMWNLSVSLAAWAEEHCPVVYYIGDVWPTLPSELHLYLQVPSRNPRRVLLKRILSKIAPLWLPPATKPVQILRFEHVLCPSQYMCDLLAEIGICRENLYLVPGAVDTSRFRRQRAEGSVSVAQNGKMSLLWVGRLVPGKDVETAIRALGHLRRQDPDVELVLTIVGGGEPYYLDHLKGVVDREKVASQVTFWGPATPNDLAVLYSQFDAFVFTSALQESFGRVLVEAMTSGLPIVATAVGGAEEVLDEGRYGLLFEAGRPRDLASQLAQLARDVDLRKDLAERGQAWACDYFDIEQMTSQIESHLRTVVRST